MSTLHDRLTQIANDAPTAHDWPDLWDRGRRRHRARTGTAVIAAAVVVLLAVIATGTWSMSRPELAPAGLPDGGTGLPDRFFTPSPRQASAAGHPIGPLVAVLGAERATDLGFGVVGVSAVTGEYRFLPLDGWTPTEPRVALSYAGDRLAYWYTDDGGDPGVLDGLAVYDTISGEIERFPIESDHGVRAEGAIWVGERLWFGYLPFSDDEHGATSERDQVVWNPVTGDRHTKVNERGPGLVDVAGGGGILAETSGRTMNYWSTQTMAVDTRHRLDRAATGPLFTSPDNTRFAVLADVDGTATASDVPAPVLLVTDLTGARMATTEVPGVRANAVLGWSDDQHIVVFDNEDATYSSVDVRTGEAEEVAVNTADPRNPSLQVAGTAWDWKTYHASPPPDPADRRLVGGAVVAVLLLGGLALVLWRRRVGA
ncbi:MAG TPA: hypothetical protein VGE14_02825 [Marmoricola sp.]